MTYSLVVAYIVGLINVIIPSIFGLMFAYFVWKVVDCWVINAADETKRNDGKKYVVAAVISFVIMISAWGIVNMIRSSIFG